MLSGEALRIADVSNLPQSQDYRVSEMGNWKSELNILDLSLQKKKQKSRFLILQISA